MSTSPIQPHSQFDFATVEYTTVVSDLIRSALGSLAAKMNAAGRQPYASATVEYDFDPLTATFTVSILTVPKPQASPE